MSVAADPNAAVNDLADRFWEGILERDPAWATLLGDDDQQVAGDHLLRLEPVGWNRPCLVQRGTEGRLLGRTTVRAEIRPAVVVAGVAEDGRPHRVAFQEAFPESVGEVVDGGVRIERDGHGAFLPGHSGWTVAPV